MPSGERTSWVRKAAALAGMVIFAAFTGLLFGFLGAIIGASIMRGELFGFGGLAGALGGMIVCYPSGAIIGIFLLSRYFHYRGTLWLGAVGCILGALATMGLAEPLNLNLDATLLFGIFFLLTPLLGTVGFHLRVKKSGGE